MTLTLKVWPWVNVMTQSWVMDNNCVKYHADPTWQWGAMTQTRILGMCALWHWPWIYDLGQGHKIPLGLGQQLYETLSRSNMAVRSHCPDTVCVHWPRRYDLATRSLLKQKTKILLIFVILYVYRYQHASIQIIYKSYYTSMTQPPFRMAQPLVIFIHCL